MTFKSLTKILDRYALLSNTAAIIVLSVLLAIGVYESLLFYTHHGNTVQVPDVVGMDIEDARETLEKAGLRTVVKDTGYITKLKADLVLAQRLKPGTIVKFNRQVLLTINAGHARRVALPSVIDGSARLAQMTLKGMGFKMGKEKRVPGDMDLVMRIEAEGHEVHMGDRISVEAPITLVVGNGDVDEHYNGNDSLDWAYALRIQQEEDQRRALQQQIQEAAAVAAGETPAAPANPQNAAQP